MRLKHRLSQNLMTFSDLVPSREFTGFSKTGCGPDRLQAILNRHLAPERGNISGIPDLFLFATPLGSNKPGIARFVEVKKPEEAVSNEQLAEIDFLNSLGLHARVLRLIEPTQP